MKGTLRSTLPGTLEALMVETCDILTMIEHGYLARLHSSVKHDSTRTSGSVESRQDEQAWPMYSILMDQCMNPCLR